MMNDPLEKDITLPFTNYNLACCYSRLHGVDLAIEYLQKAINLDPEYLDTRLRAFISDRAGHVHASRQSCEYDALNNIFGDKLCYHR